jgi:hypothetical protein
MTRTLVISDMHLGCRVRTSVLTRPAPLQVLLGALDSVDRLVLLGDAFELSEAPPREALQAAAPVMRAIGARLGPDREVIVVPGNHDRGLVRAWVREHPGAITAQTEIPHTASPALAAVTAALAPARVRVNYPGVWLADRVWATHGHYLDQHLFPTSTYGVARGWLRSPPRDSASVIQYELAARPQMSPLMRWLPRPLEALLDDLAELLRASTMPGLHRRVLNPRIAPLTAMLLGLQMRRHSIPALARVVQRLGIDADWVLFGHVHRVGPLPGDDPGQWVGPGGAPRIANTGTWLYEPLLLHRQRPPHPYWPGGAVILDDGADPRALGLLDGLAERDLR